MSDIFLEAPEHIKDHIHKKSFLAGEMIIFPGEENHSVYIVKEGVATGFVDHQDGEETFVDRYLPGDMFGELEIFCEGLKTIGITAQTDCTVERLHRQHLLQWMKEDFDCTLKIIAHLSEYMRRYADNVTKLSTKSVKQRVYDTVLEYEILGILHTLDKRALTVYAHAPMRSVNRAIAALVAEEKLTYENGIFSISKTTKKGEHK